MNTLKKMRTKFLILGLAFSTQILHAQFLDTLRIKYEKSSYWSKIKKNEIIEIIPNCNRSFERVYMSITRRFEKDSLIGVDTVTKRKVIKLENDVLTKIKKELLDSNSRMIEIDDLRTTLLPIQESRIKAIQQELIKRKIIYRKLNKEQRNSIRSLRHLEEYYISLKEYLRSHGFTTDITHNLEIELKTGNESTEMVFNFSYDNGKLMDVTVHGENVFSYKKFDPNILIKLEKYIPNNSSMKQYFNKSLFFKDYIKWYVDRNYFH